MEILVIHPGALGDIILSLPALGILRRHFEGAHITLAADTESAGAVASGYADSILSLSGLPLHRLHGTEPIPPDDLKFWRFYDRVLSWTGYGSGVFTAQLQQHHPCSLVAPWKPQGADRRHVATIFSDTLRAWLTPPPDLPSAGITIGDSVRTQGAEWLRGQGLSGDRPVCVLHPGAGSAVKRWPLSKFRDLAHRISTLGELLIVEGPAEQGLGNAMSASTRVPTHLAAQLPLPLLLGVMSHCRSFVGNDSGIAHLAAGLHIPSVVIFGPTLPEHWAPLGPHVSAVRDARNCPACRQESEARHSCLEDMSVDAVWELLSRI